MEKQSILNQSVFKQCPSCGVKWESRESFLNDSHVEIAGYQVNYLRLSAGYFLFNHSCRGTFSIPADVFKDFHDGPVYTENMAGTDKCPSYCLRRDDLRPCPIECECAFVRDILQVIKNWPNHSN